MDALISVIIPVYNAKEGLKKTLDALLRQKNIDMDSYEIIIVDNNSKDETLDVAKKYEREYSNISVYNESIQGSYAARNKGISEAKGDILCFIDADMIPKHDYLYRILSFFKNAEVQYVGTQVVVNKTADTLSATYNAISGFPIKTYLNNSYFSPTCCLVIRKSLIAEVGPFDKRLVSGGDVEFGNRVKATHYIQKYCEYAVIEHPTRNTFKDLLKKYHRIGRGNAQLSFYYPKRFGHLKRKLHNVRYYQPKKPNDLQKKAGTKGLDLSFSYCCMLSIVSVLIKFMKFYGFNKEWKNLKRHNKQAQISAETV